MLKRIKAGKIKDFLKKNIRSIAYYSAVALVLAVIAAAAEVYRSDEDYARKMVLTDEIAAEAVAEKMPEPIRPEGMRNIRAFSAAPVWNAGMQQWECHCGNDYEMEGSEIICLADGVVADTGESSMRGGYVAVDGKDGRYYIYCCVTPTEDTEAGKEVHAGEIIAAADDSLPGETALNKHLHLEVYENGQAVDFEKLCPANSETAD